MLRLYKESIPRNFEMISSFRPIGKSVGSNQNRFGDGQLTDPNGNRRTHESQDALSKQPVEAFSSAPENSRTHGSHQTRDRQAASLFLVLVICDVFRHGSSGVASWIGTASLALYVRYGSRWLRSYRRSSTVQRPPLPPSFLSRLIAAA
jgi:hypothetical protein